MSKFTEQIRILSAVDTVVQSLQYHMEDAEETKDYWYGKIDEARANGEEIDEDHYLVANAKEHLTRANIYIDLIQYLEKKYLK